MKKITAVLLTVALLIGTCGFALNASALQFPKISDKINEYNECFSNSASDGLILATVYYNNVVPMSEEEKERIIYASCGISAGELKVYSDNYRNLTDEEKQIYQEKLTARGKAYGKLYTEIADQNAAPFLEQMGITLQYNSKNVPIYNNRRVNKNECGIDICLTKNEVLQAAELDYAEGIICNRRVSKNQYRTILFENRLNWENVYVFGYDWSSNKIFGEFPGKLVEEKITDEYGDEYYAIELPRNTEDISLSNGAGEKTENIFYNETVWADYYAYYLDETEKYNSGDYKLLGFNKCESMDDPDTPGNGNFVLRDNHCWKEAYIYATDSDGNELYGAFPGKQAKRFLDYGGYQFQITVPEGAASIVVSNANGEKTVPITYLNPYWGYSLGSKNKAGDYEVNDFYGYLPEPGADEDEWLDPDYEDPTEEPAVEAENLYLDSFKEKYVDDEYWEGAELLCYEELYYCKDNNGDVEWAFIHAQTNILLPEPVDRVFYGVHVHQANIYVPFEYGYGVYDVKEDRFYDITEVCYYNETHTTPKYQSAVSYFREYYKPEKTYNQYEDEFIAWSVNKFGEECLSEGCEYDELYTHFDDGEPDWVLVSAEYLLEEPDPILWLRIGGVGGRTIFSGSIQSPFAFGYGVYNVKENEFYGLECFDDNPDKLLFVTPEQSLDYSEYDGLIEALTSLNIGYLTGDVNRDGTVDILDAAAIQKYSVGKITLDENEREFSDVNNDYRVDILDAAAIQKAAVQ